MPAIRNRSETVTVATPRGEVELLCQEMRGLRRGSGWRWFWLARRRGRGDWNEATTACEAIRSAVLLAPGKLPGWVQQAAAEAERQLSAGEGEDGTPAAVPASSETLER